MAHVMGLYLAHARSLRSPETATNHALRCGPWTEGRRASEARQVAAQITQDMRGQYADATINRTLGALSKALRLAWERGDTPEDYSARIKRLPERNMRDVVLTIDQVRALADAASEPVRAAIWIALYTGCRRGELCAIQKADIGHDTITLRAGNTKSLRTRTVPIVGPLRPWLPHLPLAVNVEGLKSGFRRARVAAGLPNVTFHDLRRSCASMMIAAGVDLYVVSKLLGHSSVAVTQARYAHLQTKAIAEGLARTFAPAITPAGTRKRNGKSHNGTKTGT
jgi:integrase